MGRLTLGVAVIVIALSPAGLPSAGAANEWARTLGGSYNDLSNWTQNIVPNAIDAEANFLRSITQSSTVTVDSAVTVGTVTFDNARSYTIGGSAQVTLQRALGDARINVRTGRHTISAPVVLGGGLTVATEKATSLTMTLGTPAVVTPDLTKEGPGTWELNGDLVPLGGVNVTGGTLQIANDLLGLPGRDVNIAGGATLKAGGIINRHVVGGAGSALEATGPMELGVLDDPNGYAFQGILNVGPHLVRLRDKDLAQVYGANLAGGTLSSDNGIELQPADVWGVYTGFRMSRADQPLTIPTSDGSGQALHPDVVRVPGGWNGYEYWMVMSPFPGTQPAAQRARFENPEILQSHDGTLWKVPDGLRNPISPAPLGSAFNSDPCLLLDSDGTLRAYWRESGLTTPQYDKILSMSSIDGITWGEKTVVVSSEIRARLASPIVREDKGVYRMWTVDVSQGSTVLQVRTGPTALGPFGSPTDATVTGLPSGWNVWHVNVTEVGGIYYMLMTTRNYAGSNQLHAGVSYDGLTWQMQAEPVHGLTPGYWDQNPYQSSLLWDPADGTFDVWYSAFNTTPEYRIGRSTLEPLGARYGGLLTGNGTVLGNVSAGRPGERPALVAGTTGPILMSGTVQGNATMINVIRTGLYKPGVGPTFLAEVPAPGATYGETEFQILGPAGGQVTGVPDFMGNGLIPGDYTQLYLAGGDLPVIGTFKIFTHDPQNPPNAYSPKLGDEFRLLVTGPFDAGFLGGSKPAATLSYPDSTGQTLFNFQDAPLAVGLDWAWRLNPDGLILTVVPKSGEGSPTGGGSNNGWSLTGGGSYSVPSNWTDNNVPNAVDAGAEFLSVITAPSTVTVDVPVTVGTINFSNTHSYTIAGPEQITLERSGSDARINVQAGQHTISAPLLLASDLTVKTEGVSSLTLIPDGLSITTHNLTKEGPGTWVLGGTFVVLGGIDVKGGTFQVGTDLLAVSGGDVNVAAGATLKATGSVNRHVLGGVGSILIVTGPSDIGLLGSTDGYDFQGILIVGPHMVGLKDANLAQLYSAQLAGGTLSSFNGIEVQPFVPAVPTSMVQGNGTINGNVTLSRPGAAFAVIRGTSGLLPITMTGTVNGNATMSNVIRTGLYKPGFSPSFIPETPPEFSPDPSVPAYGANTEIQLLGPRSGKVHGLPGFFNPDFNFGLETGDYTEFYLSMDPTSTNIRVSGPFIIFTRDPLNPTNTYSPKAGDRFELLVTGPFDMFGDVVPPAHLTYSDPTGVSLFKLEGAPLAAGLEWKWQLAPNGLTLMVVPEPGTLALLITGSLVLVAFAYRERRRQRRADGLPSGHLG